MCVCTVCTTTTNCFVHKNLICLCMYVCVNSYAITKDMDVSSGGWIEAEMFIPPIGFDVKNPNCKSGYTGIIYLDYSIDGRVT